MRRKRCIIPLLGLGALTLTGCSFFDQFNPNPSSSAESSSSSSSQSDISVEVPEEKVNAIFHAYDGSVLHEQEVVRGTDVVYDGPTPTRPSGEKYSYTFLDWDKPLEKIRATTDFYPLFQEKLRVYKASFYAGDRLLATVDAEYGSKVAYPLEEVPVPEEEGLDYAFAGWDKDPETYRVTGDIAFHAVFLSYTEGLQFFPTTVYDAEGTPIQGYAVSARGFQGKDVTIPATYNGVPVVTIAARGFADNLALERVHCPKSLLSIQEYAFSNCASLSQIEFQEGLLDIGSHVFYATSALEALVLKNGLRRIEERAFDGSGMLTLSFPKTLSYLGESAFNNCPNLVSIDLSMVKAPLSTGLFSNCPKLSEISFYGDTEEIPSYLFHNCPSLKDLTLPANVTTIREYAFDNCDKIESVVLPEKVAVLENNAFADCDALVDVTFLGEKLESLGDGCFAYCDALKSVDLPSSLKSIGHRAFASSCLEHLGLGDAIESLGAGFIEDTPLYWDETFLVSNIFYLISYSGQSYYIFRQNSAPFSRLSPLTKVLADDIDFLQSTIAVPATLCKDLGFLRRSRFYSLVLEDESIFQVKGGCIYKGTSLYRCFASNMKLIALEPDTKTILAEAFVNQYSVTEVVLNEGLESIEAMAFSGSGVYALELPSSVQSVSRGCFGYRSLGFLLYNGTGPLIRDPQFDIHLVKYDKYDGIRGNVDGFSYLINDGKAVVYRYERESSIVRFPDKIGAYDVTELSPYFEFAYGEMVEEVLYPSKLERIGEGAALTLSPMSVLKTTLGREVTTLGEGALQIGSGYVILSERVNNVASMSIMGYGKGQVFLEASAIPARFPSDFASGLQVYLFSATPIYDGRHWHYTGDRVPTVYTAE